METLGLAESSESVQIANSAAKNSPPFAHTFHKKLLFSFCLFLSTCSSKEVCLIQKLLHLARGISFFLQCTEIPPGLKDVRSGTLYRHDGLAIHAVVVFAKSLRSAPQRIGRLQPRFLRRGVHAQTIENGVALAPVKFHLSREAMEEAGLHAARSKDSLTARAMLSGSVMHHIARHTISALEYDREKSEAKTFHQAIGTVLTLEQAEQVCYLFRRLYIRDRPLPTGDVK